MYIKVNKYQLFVFIDHHSTQVPHNLRDNSKNIDIYIYMLLFQIKYEKLQNIILFKGRAPLKSTVMSVHYFFYASPLRVRAKRGQGTAGFQNFNSLLARLKIQTKEEFQKFCRQICTFFARNRPPPIQAENLDFGGISNILSTNLYALCKKSPPTYLG